MAEEVARRFMEALRDAERTGNVGELAGLFADDAELSNLSGSEPRRGREGAVAFWKDYLAVFDAIRSTFALVIEGGGAVALEWTSEGTLRGGAPIRYAGVSLLELEGSRIRRFRTYYDSAAFVSAGPTA